VTQLNVVDATRSERGALAPECSCDPHGVEDTGCPSGGSDGISIAPALDTSVAVIILALRLPCAPLPGPKSLTRIAV
jgi:hypothetical protein